MAINTSNNKVRIINTTVSGLSANSKFSDIKSPALVVNTSEGGVFYTPGDSSKLTQLAALPNHSHSNYSTTDHTHANYLSVPAYNYTNGYLVRTNIPTSSNTMATFRIEGNSYGSGSTIFTTGHFYNYTVDNNIISCQATHFGFNFGNINVFCYDGYVHLWFEQTSSYQSFIVYVYSTNNGADCVNRVSYITNGAMPSSGVTRLVEITPRKGLDNYNYSSYCASVGHSHSGYLPKSGGTLATTSPTILSLNNTNSTNNEVGLRLDMNSSSKGWVGYSTNIGTYLYTYTGPHKLGIKDDGTGFIDGNTIIHSGNIGTQSVASATNADMLDNVHIKDIPYARISSGGLGTSEESGNADTLPRTMFFRDNSANAIGYNVYHSQADTYGMQLVTGYADSDYRIRTKVNGEWKKWRKLATTEDTVAAALKSDSLYITGVGYSTSWNWEGKTGTPDWVWGGTDGTNMYVYKPYNFSVNYATSAGSVAWSNVTGKPEIYTKSSVGTLDWTSSKGKLINVDAVAHWNGAYQNTSSNLAYCVKGAFGTIVTKNVGDYATAEHTHSNYAKFTDSIPYDTSNFAYNYIGYGYSSAGWPTIGPLLTFGANSDYTHFIQGKNAGHNLSHAHVYNGTISSWSTILDSSNYTTYCASVGHSHSNYYDANVSRTKNTVLVAPNGSNGSATFRALVAADLPTVPVSKGGTGATSLTSGEALIGNGTSAVTTRSIKNMTTKGPISDFGTALMTTNTLAYWNGAHNASNRSNLTYCNHGAFGTIVTKNTDDYATANHTHPGYISHAVYNTRDSHDGSGYYLITINSTAAWMLAFHVRTYKSYTYQDIRFSGYNYGNSYWYTPTAEICSGDADSSVYFGYTSAYNLWVAIPAGNYTGIEISECLNGYTQTNLTNKDLFTITYVTSLPGTVQKEFKIKCPTNKYAAATHTHSYFPLSGGTLTGNTIKFANGVELYNESSTSFGINKNSTTRWVTINDNGITAKNFTTTSDERLKDFIDDISIDFDKLKTIPKKTYYWKDKEKYSSDLQIGTSAQALQKVYPECVNYDKDNDIYSVDYQKLSVVALAAIDVLYERISKLEEIILNSSK